MRLSAANYAICPPTLRLVLQARTALNSPYRLQRVCEDNGQAVTAVSMYQRRTLVEFEGHQASSQ